MNVINLKELIAEAKRVSEICCTDGFCRFRGRATGIHTNGGCRCTAIPNHTGKTSPYDDTIYMANLLGLIALEYEKEKT